MFNLSSYNKVVSGPVNGTYLNLDLETDTSPTSPLSRFTKRGFADAAEESLNEVLDISKSQPCSGSKPIIMSCNLFSVLPSQVPSLCFCFFRIVAACVVVLYDLTLPHFAHACASCIALVLGFSFRRAQLG